jgi:hypothetical protein
MTAWLPVILGAAFVWLVYRAGQWNERQGVIRGLEAELDMHGRWVGTQYFEKDRGHWDADYVVFKLSTVATDNAIVRGPGLFLNRDLTVALVSYRQVVGHVNQLIDKATDFQVVAELWRKPRAAEQAAAAQQLVESVHVAGIGNETLEQKPAAYVFFKMVMQQLRLEHDSGALALLWAVFGLNFSFVKGWAEWLAYRFHAARHFVATRWRTLRHTASTPEPPAVLPKVAPPRETELPSASTATESGVSRGTAVDLKITNLISANTSSWKEHARLPAVKPHRPSKVTTERTVERRDPKQG